MEEYRISLSRFEGPLDLLLHLIEKAEVNIEDIFVSEITSQYLALMEDLSDIDMDRASAFLTMAAQLLLIKSRSLLPRSPVTEEEEDPEAQLIRQLREYKAFKEASEGLSVRYEDFRKMYERLPEDVLLPPQKVDISNATLENLYAAFFRVLNRDEKKEPEKMVRNVARESFTVRNRAVLIREKLKGKRIAFDDLFTDTSSRLEKIVTFMALLEMLSHGEVRITQGATFAPIYIRARELMTDDDSYIYMDEVDD